MAITGNVRGYEAKALLEKTDQTSQSQNFVLQMYDFKRQNEVLAVLKLTSEPTKTYALPLLYEPLLGAGLTHSFSISAFVNPVDFTINSIETPFFFSSLAIFFVFSAFSSSSASTFIDQAMLAP
mgnify:CR=1 FL=1